MHPFASKLLTRRADAVKSRDVDASWRESFMDSVVILVCGSFYSKAVKGIVKVLKVGQVCTCSLWDRSAHNKPDKQRLCVTFALFVICCVRCITLRGVMQRFSCGNHQCQHRWRPAWLAPNVNQRTASSATCVGAQNLLRNAVMNAYIINFAYTSL